MILDFDVFPYRGKEDLEKIAAWLEERCRKSGVSEGVEVGVRIMIPAEKSANGAAAAMLRELLKWGPAAWAEEGYDFDFSAGSFRRNGADLHITAGEALFLYRALVQQKVDRRELYYTRNLRKRFGNDFLRGRI
jgi:hypothetical protein